MWVDRTLKCPDDGAWVALTRIDADGNTEPLGYIGLPFREAAAQALQVEVAGRDEDDLATWTYAEVVDFVLAQMHPDLPTSIDGGSA